MNNNPLYSLPSPKATETEKEYNQALTIALSIKNAMTSDKNIKRFVFKFIISKKNEAILLKKGYKVLKSYAGYTIVSWNKKVGWEQYA